MGEALVNQVEGLMRRQWTEAEMSEGWMDSSDSNVSDINKSSGNSMNSSSSYNINHIVGSSKISSNNIINIRVYSSLRDTVV